MKKLLALTIMICCMPFLTLNTVYADNVNTLIKSAEQNYTAKKYVKALEDLEWARKEIVNQHLKAMRNLLPEQINGMTGIDVEGGAVLGLHTISKKYNNDEGKKSVTISLVSGGSSQAAGGLGALMGMAASFGALEAGSNSKVVIEKGYRGQYLYSSDDKTGTLVFNLTGGKMINIETQGYPNSEMAETVAQALNIPEIEATF